MKHKKKNYACVGLTARLRTGGSLIGCMYLKHIIVVSISCRSDKQECLQCGCKRMLGHLSILFLYEKFNNCFPTFSIGCKRYPVCNWFHCCVVRCTAEIGLYEGEEVRIGEEGGWFFFVCQHIRRSHKLEF